MFVHTAAAIDVSVAPTRASAWLETADGVERHTAPFAGSIPARSPFGMFLDNLMLTEYKRRVGQLTEEAANGQEQVVASLV
jgi:hypothetical protein